MALKEVPLSPLENFDLQTYIDQGGFGFGETSVPIVLVALFKNGAGHHLIETPLAVDQQIERLNPQTNHFFTAHYNLNSQCSRDLR